MSAHREPGHVETLRGPVPVGELGVTLPHEHLFLRNRELEESYPHLFVGENEMVDAARTGLQRLIGEGVQTLVDVTVLGIGRDLARIRRAADGLAINIVLATGAFFVRDLPTFFSLHGPDLPCDEPDPLDAMFLRDIEAGIENSDVKAGVIKIATDIDGMLPGPERVFRAAARVHTETNVPITTHSHAASFGGLEQQRVLSTLGVGLDRVVIGHSGDTRDLGYLRELIDNGSLIGMDRFGVDSILSFEERVETVVQLCAEGYADRMLLSCDAFFFACDYPQQAKDKLLPNVGMTSVAGIAKALEDAGVSPAQIWQMTVVNPATFLAR